MWATLDKEGVLVDNSVTGTHPDLPMRLNDKESFYKFCDIWEEVGSLRFSSQLNWPEEVTDDRDILVICDLLTGNNITGIQDKIKEAENAVQD